MELSDQLHVPAALPLRKNLWYPLSSELGGHQSRSERVGEERHLLPLTGIETPPTHLNTLASIS